MSENGSEIEQITSSNLSDNQSKNGDEQIHNMSVGEIDPAILYVRERTKIKYTKEELLEIAENPFSKTKPDFLNPNEVCATVLDPEKWNLERKKSDTPETGPHKANENGDNTRRRPNDPRERIRKENDGIVLSPQRRSFNTGCFVPSNKEPAGGKNDAPPHMMVSGVREIPSSTRRIGSGRIIRDSWDNDKDSGEPEFNFSRGARNNERDDKFGERASREENKFAERRSFVRDMDSGKDKEIGNRRNPRYSETRRRYSEHREDEPEWFSSGPISQNDTIELRGFDESDKPSNRKKRVSASQMKRSIERAKDWNKKKETIVEDKERDEDEATEARPPSSQHESGGDGEEAAPKERNAGQEQKTSQNQNMFDFDEFLKGENIPGLLANGVDEPEKSTSRFSRWFKKESPNKDTETSRRSSIQEDNHIMKDLLKDLNESSSIPLIDSNTYFAPISPAGNTTTALGNLIDEKVRIGQNLAQSVNIMEMLARGKQPPNQQQPEGWNTKQQAPPAGGKILSLDELEANIRQKSDHSANMQQKATPAKPDEEMTAAFKRLLQQAGGHTGSQNGAMNKPPAMSLLEMLNHSQQQDEARFAAAQAAASQQQMLNAGLHQQPQPSQSQINDLTMKLQQAQLQQKQMDMLGKLMASGAVPAASHMRASPLLEMGPQQSRELLNRPEAQAILQGLKRGELTIQHLYQQLANPALQHRHREMLLTILKLHGNSAGYGPSPRVLSPVPPHHLYPPPQANQMQQQQLRVSPLPPNAYCVSPIMATSPNHLAIPAMHQRIPSPRELQVHTQNILQRALIKKKLEEQSENFRKKQELQRGTSPNPIAGNQQSGGKGVSSPTPLAFTPTSVLRKMTADKDEGKENKAVTDNGIKPQGRPLTGMRQQPPVTVGNQQQWNQPFQMKQAGRPIVKANNYQSQTPDQFFAQLAAQQQPLPQQRTYQAVPTAPHRKPIIGQQYQQQQGSQYGPSQSQYPHPNPQSFSSQPTAQQLRAQHQARPTTTAQQQQPGQAAQQGQQKQNQAATSQKLQQPMGFQQQGTQQQQQQQANPVWQQFFNSATQQQNSRQVGPRSQSGALSPSTADQLTRWFSPDLLERARVGDLPSTANLARLEEIERQAAAPVHN